MTVVCYLACWGLTFVPPDSANHLLAEPELNITVASKVLFLLLSSLEPDFKEALYWLQFVLTGNQMGSYIAPVSTVLVLSVITEGEPLFATSLDQSQRSFLLDHSPQHHLCFTLLIRIALVITELFRRPSVRTGKINQPVGRLSTGKLPMGLELNLPTPHHHPRGGNPWKFFDCQGSSTPDCIKNLYDCTLWS